MVVSPSPSKKSTSDTKNEELSELISLKWSTSISVSTLVSILSVAPMTNYYQ